VGGSRRVLQVGYVPRQPSGVRAELQRIDRHHDASRWGLHAHVDFYELVVFDSAGGGHGVDGQLDEVRPGRVALLPPGHAHDWSRLEAASARVVIFTAEAVGVRNLQTGGLPWPRDPLLAAFRQSEGRAGAFELSGPQWRCWRGWLDRFEVEQTERAQGYDSALRSLLNLLLVDASRLTRSRTDAVDLRTIPLLVEVFRFIDRRYRDPVSLVDVARHVDRSPGHVTQTVRQATGRTVGEWIVQRRMSEARDLLLDSDLPVAEVGRRVGYGDPVHFTRVFRRCHGHPPGAWRRDARGTAEPLLVTPRRTTDRPTGPEDRL
jgi:AraC-like DNA-binding protein